MPFTDPDFGGRRMQELRNQLAMADYERKRAKIEQSNEVRAILRAADGPKAGMVRRLFTWLHRNSGS